MQIVRVEAIPLTTPYGTPGAQTRERSAVFVEVEVADGTVGVGETYLGVYMPELAIEAVKFFEPFLIGRDSTNIAKCWSDCQWISSYVGRTGPTVMALSAIECALWDILGKRLGIPVHTLLGGAVHDRIPLYASGGVPTFTLDQLVSHTKEVVRDGYLGFKMRANPIAYQPAIETERVAAVREALGPDRLLAVDAVQNFNPQPWSVKQALDLLDQLAPYHLAWAEEFLPHSIPRPTPSCGLAAKSTSPEARASPPQPRSLNGSVPMPSTSRSQIRRSSGESARPAEYASWLLHSTCASPCTCGAAGRQ